MSGRSNYMNKRFQEENVKKTFLLSKNRRKPVSMASKQHFRNHEHRTHANRRDCNFYVDKQQTNKEKFNSCLKF